MWGRGCMGSWGMRMGGSLWHCWRHFLHECWSENGHVLCYLTACVLLIIIVSAQTDQKARLHSDSLSLDKTRTTNTSTECNSWHLEDTESLTNWRRQNKHTEASSHQSCSASAALTPEVSLTPSRASDCQTESLKHKTMSKHQVFR